MLGLGLNYFAAKRLHHVMTSVSSALSFSIPFRIQSSCTEMMTTMETIIGHRKWYWPMETVIGDETRILNWLM